jgi:DHA1 family tetracycline resistance protein-like MFS transporter
MIFLSKLVLFTAFFFDFFSFSLIIPLLPLLVFEYCPEKKYIVLGFLLATYPLAQMIGSPRLGKLADRKGKKQVLLLSYLGNLIGYLFSACAILTHQIAFLFLGHLIAGFLGANMSMTYALIADDPCEKSKFKSFSLTSFLLATTFIISPLISKTFYLNLNSIDQLGLLTLLIAFLVSLFNLTLIGLTFKSPLAKPLITPPAPSLPLHKNLLISTFLFFFAWYGFIKFFQAYVLDDLAFPYYQFCSLLSLIGVSSALTQLFNYLYLSRFTPHPHILKGAIYLLALSLSSLLVVETYKVTVLITILIAISHALISPHLLYAFSTRSSGKKGEMMGQYQAIQASAKTLAPPILGLLMTSSLKLPIALCSLCLLICPEIHRLFSYKEEKSVE